MVTVSESLKKGVENFLEVTPQVTSHMENRENPHGLGNVKDEEQATKAEFNLHAENSGNPHAVTKEQVGLGNVKNEEQATKAEFLAEQERVSSHMENAENPHGVTKSQVGLGNVKNEEQATKAEFLAEQERVTAFMERADNPHAVTKAQVGLEKVKNEEQATAVQYAEHVAGSADKHSGADIMYSDTKSVNEKIDELIVEGGSGTMYHNELLNRDGASQHPISAIDGLRGELDALSESTDALGQEFLKKIDEVLVFEGVTTDATRTDLLSQTQSDFIVNGYFTLPVGYGADVEVSVLALRENEGKIHSVSCAGLFRAETFVMRINSMMANGLADFTSENALYKMTPQTAITGDSSEFVYECGLGFGAYSERCITVIGAEGHRIFWRGIIKIKNILKVEAE